jgi:NAD(P)-dependent dehydrogenase (short-subunit alcohol dehydrogenase family)
MKLAGRNAVVTGGAVRIGRALALGLAERGVNVCIHYGSSGSAAEATLAGIADCGVRGTAIQADFREPVAAAVRVFEHACTALGSVDLLVNSAAIFEAGDLLHTDESLWDRHLDINLKTPAFLSREFAARLPPDRNGHIVNIVDWRGERPGTGYLAYTVAKAGLIAMTRGLALELAPRIQVNAIAPGAILPPPGESAESFQQRAAAIPLRRTGNPQAIVDAIIYLFESDFITGQVLTVTGGEDL